jgi:hypothetical protein
MIWLLAVLAWLVIVAFTITLATAAAPHTQEERHLDDEQQLRNVIRYVQDWEEHA